MILDDFRRKFPGSEVILDHFDGKIEDMLTSIL